MTANPSTGKTLLMAIHKEMEARAFYRAASRMVANPLVRRRLLSLADDEGQHIETLSRLYWAQTGTEPGEILPPAASTGPSLEGLDLAQVIRLALEEEEKACRLYAKMAEEAADPRVQAFLEYLMDFEKSHHQLLSQEMVRLEKDPSFHGITETGDG